MIRKTVLHTGHYVAERYFRIPDSDRGMAGLPSLSSGAGPGCESERQVETTATSALAQVQFAVASAIEVTETLVRWVDVECHIMREDIIVAQSTRRSRCAVCAPAPTAASGLSRRTALVPRSRSRSTAHSSRGHLTTSRLHHEDLSDVTRSSVTLSWLAPTSNDGAAIMAYVIERPEHLSPTWTRVARVQPQTTVDTVGNLAERTDYQFRVCAENVDGA